MNKIDHYAVFGSPINHSKSPRIHRLFAEQTQQNLDYVAQEVNAENFVAAVTEFFAQGAKELELGLPLTPMCDSTKTRVSSQIGFSKFVARAAFSALVRIFPSLNILISNLDENDKRWADYDDTKLLSEVPAPAWS